MPNRWAVQNGNWSNTATWNSGATLLLPTASDVVFTNGFNVTIDQPNITVIQLRNTATSSVAEGGTFISTNLLQISCSAGSTVATGGIIGGTGSIAGVNSACFTITGSDFVGITGSIFGGFGSIAVSGANKHGLIITNGGTGSVVGNVFGGQIGNLVSSANNYGIFVITGSVTVTGSLTGGSSNESVALSILNGTASISGTLQLSGFASPIIIGAGSAQVNFTGTSSPGTSTNSPYANVTAMKVTGNNNGVINYNGPVISGHVPCIRLSAGTMTVNITGSVLAGGLSNVVDSAIISSVASVINVNGSITAASNTPAIQSTSTSGLVRVTGPLINQGNMNAVYSPRIQWISSSATYYDIQSETFNQDVILYDPAYPITFPPTSSVRSGSLYGATNQLTGSMIVPVPSDVRYGVPVDNTTGSATLTPQDIFDFATQNLTGSNTIGARLQNISTVQTTAATIAAFKGK
jgi:hypothetical protein